jgi:hypothetical protein
MSLPDDVWIDDVVRWFAKGLLWGAAGVTVAAMLVAYGEARMSSVALQAFTDAQRCAALVEPLLGAAERAAAEADRASLVLDSYLDEAPTLGVLVAEVEQ